ncbi:CLUMA_CG010707, isoform A [Clunio marinus]|uniref:CLUMA_CG010707, isoform A n=1 Tax=Clunio marinus TaxID=568069 RepID=A0A1J1IFT4_9DIPT|nr:CLUMA_CG010707, isoform A [Clunio marinus]
MWYLVNLPGNKLNIAVKTEKNSIAADCLNKVCSDLGIICETDYFGLLYADQSHDSHYQNVKQWINLRNPLDKRHRGEGPTMLELRVKFWVPSHLILQESVREIFYMQARQMLIDGEINPTNWMQAARLIALVSQAEGVKFSPELLSDTCQKFIENLSLRVQKIKCSKNYKDKPTKRTFVIEMKADKNCDNECENSHLEKLIMDNYVENLIFPDDINKTNSNDKIINNEISNDFFVHVAREHQKINTMTTSSAKYWLLEEFATLKKFGEEFFEGMLISETNSSTKTSQPCHDIIQIAVSPLGLNIKKANNVEIFHIPFSAVESAKSLRRCFHLCYLDENFAVTNFVVKFASHRIAGTLYRSLTEKHAFYSCETVHKNVETQFIRDLKGTIISMFNEDTQLGKKYVFDIRLTFRELYDNSRRILHARGVDLLSKPNYPEESVNTTHEAESKRIDLTCSICMDNKIDTLFLPCAHLSCCRSCAQKCETCPLCRNPIKSTSVVYFT